MSQVAECQWPQLKLFEYKISNIRLRPKLKSKFPLLHNWLELSKWDRIEKTQCRNTTNNLGRDSTSLEIEYQLLPYMWEWVLMIDCQSGMGCDEHSCTVQEHDDYCFRYVAKAKPTDLNSEENVLPTYKWVVSRLHGSWSNTVFRRGKWEELCCIQEKLRERWWIKAMWFHRKEKRAST